MAISRAELIRGLAAGAALLPATALARGRAADLEGFAADVATTDARPWTGGPLPGGGLLRFAVIGDNTGLARPGVFEQGIKQVSWLQPDFILSVGDLIEGYTEDRAEIARQWAAIDAAIAKVNLPFVYAPGNHDVNNAETLEAWRERRGAGYYSFTYKGALFIILNTENTPTPMPAQMSRQFYGIIEQMKADPDAVEKMMAGYMSSNGSMSKGEYGDLDVVHFGDRQLAFVRDVLARHPKPRWTFVVVHKPAWKMQSPEFRLIQAMLKGRPYTVFAGHTHYFTHEVIDGADYINMGTTGGIIHQKGPGTMDHTILVTLTPEGPVYGNQRLTGLLDVTGQSGQVRAY